MVLDPVSQTAEITPLRSVEFTANVTQFLQPPVSSQHLMGIEIDPASDFNTGYILVDVIFTHPFPGLDMYTGFDVRGVCIGDGSITGKSDSGILYAGEEDLRVLNADGLSRWFNPAEFTSYETIIGFTLGKLGTPSTGFTATLNGCKYYCDLLDAGDDVAEFFADPSCLNPRGYFSAGTTNRRTYELQFPLVGSVPQYEFQYAVVASWENPDPNPPEYIPDDFPVSAWCQEAFAISTADKSTMFYIGPADNGGDLILDVTVFDRQGFQNSVGVHEEISTIHLESPDGLIVNDYVTFDNVSLTTFLVESNALLARYELVIPEAGLAPFASGDFPVLVVVESLDPESYDSGFPGFAYPENAVLSAYSIASVNVTDNVPYQPPVAVAEIVSPPPYCLTSPIEFDASASYDQDEGGSSIVSYEWDFDGDEIYGDSYDSGTDVNPSKLFTVYGLHEVDVRVTDDEGATDTLDELLGFSIGGETWVDDDAVSPFDGSYDHPWPTIQEGINNAFTDCGDKWVLVKDGTYQENITLVSNITVEGYSTPAPLIEGPDASASHMVNFGGSSNSTLKHFQVKPRTSQYGINMGTSSNTVEDIEFIDNPGGPTCSIGIYGGSWSSSNLTVDNIRCDGYHKDRREFIYIRGSGSSITDCVLLNMDFTIGATTTGVIGVITLDDGGSTSLVARNVIGHITWASANTQWIRTLVMTDSQGSTLRNNLLFDLDNNCSGGWTYGIDADYVSNATVEHNTVTGITCPSWLYSLEVSHFNQSPSGVIHRDHIVSHIQSGGWRRGYCGSWSSPLPVDYSCYYSVSVPFYGQVVAGIGFLSNVNPQYMDSSNDDYRISSGSPCENTAHDGTDMGAYGGSDPLTWVPD